MIAFFFTLYILFHLKISASSGRNRLRVCQPWAADQRPGGRDLRAAADSVQPSGRRREESEPVFGCSGGENLTGVKTLTSHCHQKLAALIRTGCALFCRRVHGKTVKKIYFVY